MTRQKKIDWENKISTTRMFKMVTEKKSKPLILMFAIRYYNSIHIWKQIKKTIKDKELYDIHKFLIIVFLRLSQWSYPKEGTSRLQADRQLLSASKAIFPFYIWHNHCVKKDHKQALLQWETDNI